MEQTWEIRSELFTMTLLTPLVCIIWSMISIWFHEFQQENQESEEEEALEDKEDL